MAFNKGETVEVTDNNNQTWTGEYYSPVLSFKGKYHQIWTPQHALRIIPDSWVSGESLDFSALSALPVSRQSAVETAADAAATTLEVEPQSIIDALAVGRGLASLLPNDGCLLASSGGSVTSQGDPVGAIQSWTGTELATQSNASLQPVSGADGLVTDKTKEMSLGNLSSWTEGEAFVVTEAGYTKVTYNLEMFWKVGTSNFGSHIPHPNDTFYEDFGNTLRRQTSTVVGGFDKGIYNPRMSAAGLLSIDWNGVTCLNNPSNTVGFNSDAVIFSGGDSLNSNFFIGTWSALALNPSLYTTAQRDAVREFCKEYYGVTY